MDKRIFGDGPKPWVYQTDQEKLRTVNIKINVITVILLVIAVAYILQ